uniref:Uncharacterized protein n=1 Tax=Cacopsylla melanoneura TaxID=428564 RepID=A0A8D8UTN6_9HEMI
MLGFIFRSTRDFPDTLSFKILYCSLVRSVLEFSSCIWNPSYAFHSGRIERIQHRALRMLDGKSRSSVLSSSSSSPPYFLLESSFNLLPLSIRREMFDMISFFNILHSDIDTSLIESININVPGYSATRHTFPFRPQFVSTNYLQNCPLTRFQRSANSLKDQIDFFSTSVSAIKIYYSRQLNLNQ